MIQLKVHEHPKPFPITFIIILLIVCFVCTKAYADETSGLTFSHFDYQKEVDCHGKTCKFNFSIDWPVSGEEALLYNTLSWIINVNLPYESEIMRNPRKFCDTVIEAYKDSGAIERNVIAKINLLQTGFTEVETDHNWRAGEKEDDHWGRTTVHVLFVTADGNKVTHYRITEGDDH